MQKCSPLLLDRMWTGHKLDPSIRPWMNTFACTCLGLQRSDKAFYSSSPPRPQTAYLSKYVYSCPEYHNISFFPRKTLDFAKNHYRPLKAFFTTSHIHTRCLSNVGQRHSLFACSLNKSPPSDARGGGCFLGNLCSFDFSAVFTAVCCWAAFSPLLYELRQHRRGDCVDDNSLATCNQGKTEDTQQVFIHRKPQMLQLNTCKSDSCETRAHKAISSSPGDLQQQQVHFKEAAGVTTIKELSDFNKWEKLQLVKAAAHTSCSSCFSQVALSSCQQVIGCFLGDVDSSCQAAWQHSCFFPPQSQSRLQTQETNCSDWCFSLWFSIFIQTISFLNTSNHLNYLLLQTKQK